MNSPKNDLDNSPNDVNIDITFDIKTFIEKIIKIGNLRWNIKKNITLLQVVIAVKYQNVVKH